MLTHYVAEPAFDRVTRHRIAHCLGNDESGTRPFGACRIRCVLGCHQVHDDRPSGRPPPSSHRQGEILPTAKARARGQHRVSRLTSGREGGATLGPAGRQDRAPGAGAHAQPEAVGLRAPTVVRLEGALAHVRHSVFICPTSDDTGEQQPGGLIAEQVNFAVNSISDPLASLAGTGYCSASEQPDQRTRAINSRQNGRFGVRVGSALLGLHKWHVWLWTTVEYLWTTLLRCASAWLNRQPTFCINLC
jgi:hypothetical protein